ncbi:MAG: RNA polymerase sigma factor [Terriglobales bacterium]
MEKVWAAPLTPAADNADTISAEKFDEIILLHQRRVYRVIWLLVKDPDVAGTLTQECFLRAYQKRSGFRGECRIDTWLLKIAVNLVRDHCKNRRHSFWKKLVGLDQTEESCSGYATDAPSPERTLLAREQLAEVWRTVDFLPDQQRTIFLLRFAEELPLMEIADILRLQLGTVKAQLFRATGKVREAVKETYANREGTKQRTTD